MGILLQELRGKQFSPSDAILKLLKNKELAVKLRCSFTVQVQFSRTGQMICFVEFKKMNIKLTAGLTLAGLLLVSSLAQALPTVSVKTQNLVVAAATDCSSSASQVVAQTGGQLLSATPATQNGQAVCKVTVLVKSSSGQRPKKMSVTVPQ